MSKISMTPEQMQMRVGELKRAEQDYTTVLTNMQNMMTTLQQEWHGEASRGFAEQFDRLKTQSFKPMRQLLEDMARQLSEAARVIQEMDQQMAGKFRG